MQEDTTVTSNASRTAALPVAPTLHALPDALKLHILGNGGPRCALLLEAASRALDLRRVARTAYDAFWREHLLERWPCEGPALCSLVGPQATPRQLYEAFATKRIARRNIHGEVELSSSGYISSVYPAYYPDDVGESSGDEDSDKDHYAADYPIMGRVAFILTVGGFARTARFTKGPKGEASPNEYMCDSPGLGRIGGPHCIGVWEVLGGEAIFDFGGTFPPDGLRDVPTWDPATTREVTGSQLSQSLYAIDLQSFKCVALFENLYPDDIGELANDQIYLRYFSDSPDIPVYFRHEKPVEYESPSELESDGKALVDVLRLDSHFDLEPCVDAGPFVYRLRHTNIGFRDRSEYCVHDKDFCPYILDIIQQTHA